MKRKKKKIDRMIDNTFITGGGETKNYAYVVSQASAA
jgi:hypothetical protein